MFSSDKNRSGEKIGLEKNLAAQKQAIGAMAEKNGSSERNVAAQKQSCWQYGKKKEGD